MIEPARRKPSYTLFFPSPCRFNTGNLSNEILLMERPRRGLLFL
jgi:hypothetical protein